VEPTLPSLKAILAAPHSMPGYHQLLHGFLSGCTLSIDELGWVRYQMVKSFLMTFSGREGVLSTKKIKNNMLCAVLVLTMFRDNLRLSQTAVEHFCRILTSKLVENTEARKFMRGATNLAHCSLPGVIDCCTVHSHNHHCCLVRESLTPRLHT
jgi:hypothetical protein